jgi:Leucine-rich repeat (LRR) protein
MKKIFFIIALCGFFTNAYAQIVNIPDANFKNALVSTSCADFNNDGSTDGDADTNDNGEIELSEAQALLGLAVRNNSISDPMGIEFFTNLRYLYCSSNPLSSLNVQTLTYLERLECENGQITSLDVHGLTNLQYLNCNNQFISNLNIQGLVNLQYLYCCYDNMLVNLDVQGLTNLKYLYCYNSHLTNLNVQGLSNLQHLYCYDNSLISLNVQGLTNLAILKCYNNQLTNINLQGLVNLQTLQCYNNQIVNLDAQGLTNLQILHCYSNHITNFSIQGLLNLQTLWCYSNPIGSLNVQGLTSLQDLACNENQLTSINVQGLLNLQYLDCMNNDIASLNVQGIPNLKKLYCDNNRITTLDLHGMASLQRVECIGNLLTSLNIQGLINIHTLGCQNNKLMSLDIQGLTNLQNLNCHDNPIFCLSFLPQNLYNLEIYNTNITCLPNRPPILQNSTPLCLPSNPNGCLFAARIYGSIKKAVNCAATTQNLANMLVTATNIATSEIYVANSDTSGGYEIAVPTGTYTVSVAPPNGYWGVCTNAQNIVITQSGQQESRDVLLNAVVACADMSVRHTDAAVMRPCTTSVYRVSYFNAGTIAAAGAYAEITLAAEQTFVSASLPSLALGGGRFRFQLPTVAALQRGTFDVNVQVACSVIMGQQLCTDVAVFPHTFCNPPALWDGSDVAVSGRCVGNNQVRFILTNRGAGAMSAPQTYSIIEDNLMIRSGQIQLLVAGSDSVTITADPLRVYRIVVNESPYNPAGNTQETVLVWGCNGLSQNIHWASVNQYPLNSGADYIHRLCTTVRSSFDPNDISAVPAGVDAQHFIENNTVLEYKIRFQNTGNDTAFVVRLLNQLPPELDKTTLKIGTASHPFTYSLKADGVLEFLFTNIRLEDSTSNEPKSHGFVTYSIKPKPNLAAGTTIHNQANIYFDTNAPVATNIYTHTIGEIVVSTVQSIDNQKIIVKIMPNPMHDAAIFEIGDSQSPTLLTLYNTLGQTIKTQPFVDGKLILERDNLPQGCYFYKISNANGLLTQGKLIME